MVKTLLGKERESVIEKLEDIADHVGLTPSDKKRYIKFAIGWYNDSGKRLWLDRAYGTEWASRFQWDKEYYLADSDRIRLLIKVDGMRNARSRFAKQLIARGGWQRKKAYEYVKGLHPSGNVSGFKIKEDY